MTGHVEKSDWGLVVLVLLAGITTAAFVGKAPPALPLLRDELGLTIVQAGWVISAISAMAMATGMAAGIIADRVGHRRVLITGLIILMVSGTIGAMGQGATLLLITRFCEGVGFISVAVSAPSLIVTSIPPHHRPAVLGLWSVWLPGGIALSIFISPLILGPLGWRWLWLLWAVLAAVLVAALLLRGPARNAPPTVPTQRHSFARSLRLVFSRPGPLILALNFGVFATQWGSLMMWLPSFLVEERGLSVTTAAMLGGLAVAVNIPGNLIGSWMLHHGVERRHLIGGTHLVMGLCAIGIFSEPLPDVARYGLALVFSHAAGYLPAAVFASIPVHAPSAQQFGATSGLLLQGSNVGNFFGPPAFAALVAATGSWNDVLWLMLICAGAGTLLTLALGVVERRT